MATHFIAIIFDKKHFSEDLIIKAIRHTEANYGIPHPFKENYTSTPVNKTVQAVFYCHKVDFFDLYDSLTEDPFEDVLQETMKYLNITGKVYMQFYHSVSNNGNKIIKVEKERYTVVTDYDDSFEIAFYPEDKTHKNSTVQLPSTEKAQVEFFEKDPHVPNVFLYNELGITTNNVIEALHSIKEKGKVIFQYPNEGTKLSKQAKKLHKEKKHTQALETINAAIVIDDNEQVCLLKSDILKQLKQYDEQKIFYTTIIKKHPNYSSLRWQYGVDCSEINDWKSVYTVFKEETKYDPTDEGAVHWVGNALIKQNKKEKATPYLHQSIEMYLKKAEITENKEDKADSFYWAAAAYALLEDYTKACELLKTAFELDSSLKKQAKKEEEFSLLKHQDQFKKLIK